MELVATAMRKREPRFALADAGELVPLIEKVWQHCEAKQLTGGTVTLNVKFADFQQITRSRTLPRAIDGAAETIELARALLAGAFPVTKGIRLLSAMFPTSTVSPGLIADASRNIG